MGLTTIEWTDRTWSPLRAQVREDAVAIARAKGYTSLIKIAEKMTGHVGQHCEHVSHGCDHCWAESDNHRCRPNNGTGLPYDRRSRDLVETIADEKILMQPLSWRKPQRVFVENQSDLFGDWVTDEAIDRVFAVMALCPQHTFQVLTKRPTRMLNWMCTSDCSLRKAEVWRRIQQNRDWVFASHLQGDWWPLKNVWLGVSVEDQETADERIPLLLQTPAAVRFVSYEPALGPVDFNRFFDEGLECNYCRQWRGTEGDAKPDGNEEDPGFLCPRCGEAAAHLPLNEHLDWVIVGGESGSGARPFDIAWARNTIAQCKDAGVACFVKQLGAKPTGTVLDPKVHVTARTEIKLRDREGPDSKLAAPVVFSSLSPAKPTAVYDTYWRFAAERQEIFFRRCRQSRPPWTSDPILTEFKFTNAYRASDRVSQYLIQHVIYRGEQSDEEIFFRTLLFKLFNKIETWELFERAFQQVTYRDFRFESYDQVLTDALTRGETIYSAAYIMPSGSSTFGTTKKHRAHLKLLAQMMNDEVALRISEARNMRDAFMLLRSYPTIGDFLAYQYVTDLNYSTLTNFSEMEFVVPGPGAKSGISKCFESLGGIAEEDIIRVITDRQSAEFERLGIDFKSLWGRPLQLIDCQNLFCEVDKYARVYHPDITGSSQRTRIKQKFRPTARTIEYWFPPKWGLNDKIKPARKEATR